MGARAGVAVDGLILNVTHCRSELGYPDLLFVLAGLIDLVKCEDKINTGNKGNSKTS